MVSRSNARYHAVQLGRKNVHVVRLLLRSIGLKILTLQRKIGANYIGDSSEQEQILVDVSKKIASSRIAVHLLPVAFTICLFLMNGIEILNEPQITTPSTFFLQVAAKLHELLITASLGVVVLDVVRYELLHEGLNLGLMVSQFSMVGLNFLWSIEMLSIFKASYTRRKRIWLFSVIATCCILISVVGPSSAVLFIPSQVWRPYGWTDYYLGDTDQNLWPTQLTARHAGPDTCTDPARMTSLVCPAGGYPMLAAHLRKNPEVAYVLFVQDAHYTRTIQGYTPRFNYSWENQNTQESWVMSSRGDVTFMLQDLENVYRDAQKTARGRSRRLRDFVDGSYQITESKIPVGRTVCAPARYVTNDTKTFLFPVLDSNQKWRNISFASNETYGQLLGYDISNLLNFSSEGNFQKLQARWIALGPEYGAVTAGLAFLTRNTTHSVGFACTLDYRWALGQTWRAPVTIIDAYRTHVGKENTPSSGQNLYEAPNYRDFLHPYMTSFYGETIKVDQDWLDKVFPVYAIASEADGHNTTTFEAMVEPTILSQPNMIMSRYASDVYLSISTLEYMAGVAFVDILARTNWYTSLKYPDDSMTIDPVLQQPSGDPRRVLNGAPIYLKPNESITTLRAHWHTHGTAWTLSEPGQWLAISVLILYLLIAFVHSVITLRRGTSMEAWDSITELFLLAWNSEPTRRDAEFKNASVGIHTMKTMSHKVKVVVVEEDGEQNKDANGRVELVVVDEKAKSLDGRVVHDVVAGEVYR